MINPPTAVTRQAQALVRAARTGGLRHRMHDITLEAVTSPQNAARLIVLLASMAAGTRPVIDGPDDQEKHNIHLRAAHAAYFRGERARWVADGEREYQREKKRQYARARAARVKGVA